MSTNALLIDLDELYSDSLPTPPPTISSATPVTLHHDEPPEEELSITKSRPWKTSCEERARRWEISIRETKEKELMELKKRMGITRANGDTKEAQDSAGSDGGELQRRAECNGKMSPPIPATTTRDIGLNTDSPDHAIPPILGLDSQTSKPSLPRPDTCLPSQSQVTEIPGSPTPTSPGTTTLGSPATFSSFFAKALADVSRDSSTSSPRTFVNPNMSGNSASSTPTTHDPARAQTMVLLNQVRSEKRALEMRVNELIARNNSLSTEKSTIQKRLDETQKARLR
ncbi:hypothetical protein EHS25_002173 [Saitozyma podzolica]|uniref:Uncharacterized protein n=1 Tax=Saitozyma podzolica TaxID=1890683 RepID=A0A427YEV3_9TREE|nr:hypothetical protein EHS25_002173 [Saitozyma podzolica]